MLDKESHFLQMHGELKIFMSYFMPDSCGASV